MRVGGWQLESRKMSSEGNITEKILKQQARLAQLERNAISCSVREQQVSPSARGDIQE